jgi:hypothetical protein
LTNGTHEVVISMSEGSTSMVVDGFMWDIMLYIP